MDGPLTKALQKYLDFCGEWSWEALIHAYLSSVTPGGRAPKKILIHTERLRSRRLHMTRILLLLACLLFAPIIHARWLKAEDLERLCASKLDSERTVCVFIINAYVDGFVEGVAKGVFGTYKYDEQVLNLVKGVKARDMAPRVKKVIEVSTCMQSVSVADMTETFLDYVRRTPSSRTENYRYAMTSAIISKYCSR